MHAHHVETVVQVLAERAFTHELHQVNVGRRQHTRIDLEGTRGADALDFTFLKRAQEFGLQGHRHGRHFIDEEGATVGQFESAHPRVDRAGKRALGVAEQFRLRESFRNRGRVKRDKRLVTTRAVVVNGPGHQFLARAGLALNQDRALHRRDQLQGVEQFGHRRGGTHHPVKPEPLVELGLEERVFAAEPVFIDGRAQHMHQLAQLEGLEQEVGRAFLDGGDGLIHTRHAADDDRPEFGVAVNCLLQHLHAVAIGQPEVHHQRVKGKPSQALPRFGRRGGLRDREARGSKGFGDGASNGRVVLNHEDRREFLNLLSHEHTPSRSSRSALGRAGEPQIHEIAWRADYFDDAASTSSNHRTHAGNPGPRR